MNTRKWTQFQLDFLGENYGKLQWAEIGEKIGRTPLACEQMAQKLGIKKSRDYTQRQIQTVREMYADHSTQAVAKATGRTVCSVYNLAFKLGLRKSVEYLGDKKRKEIQRLLESGKGHRFPKGHVPVNKGLRRPGWKRGRMAETQFKKGQFAANRREIGSERMLDGYVYVKVADGQKNRNWRQKHYVVWERHNGPIPKGCIVSFKDGDRQNFSLENLELITRVQLMNRNTLHNYPEPLKGTIHQLAGMKRRLNRYAKEQDRGSEEHPV